MVWWFAAEGIVGAMHEVGEPMQG